MVSGIAEIQFYSNLSLLRICPLFFEGCGIYCNIQTFIVDIAHTVRHFYLNSSFSLFCMSRIVVTVHSSCTFGIIVIPIVSYLSTFPIVIGCGDNLFLNLLVCPSICKGCGIGSETVVKTGCRSFCHYNCNSLVLCMVTTVTHTFSCSCAGRIVISPSICYCSIFPIVTKFGNIAHYCLSLGFCPVLIKCSSVGGITCFCTGFVSVRCTCNNCSCSLYM